MKRSVIMILACLMAATAFAQGEIYTSWPYYYSDFQEGTILLTGGRRHTRPLNVHLLEGKIHFVDEGGIIREADNGKMINAQIGDDIYKRVDGRLMQAIPGPDDSHFIAVSRTADLQALNETGGAYGVSSTSSSTRKLSSLETSQVINTHHMDILQHKEDGTRLDIKTEYYIVRGHECVKATKRDINKSLDKEGKARFKAFLKDHKINWKDPESLKQLFEFYND